MKEGGRPEFSQKTGAIEEGSCSDAKLIIVNLNCAVSGGAVGTTGFDSVVKFP